MAGHSLMDIHSEPPSREAPMTTKKVLLLTLSSCIMAAGYATLLIKLPPPPPAKFNHCAQHMNACPVLSGKLWP